MSSVLVIDHDPVVAKLLEVSLRSKGHDVAIARDTAAGRLALETGGHDMVIVDVFLPDGSGLDVLRYLRNDLDLRLPVIVLSGHRQGSIAVKAIETGATHYMTKPFSPQALLADVDRLTEVAHVGG